MSANKKIECCDPFSSPDHSQNLCNLNEALRGASINVPENSSICDKRRSEVSKIKPKSISSDTTTEQSSVTTTSEINEVSHKTFNFKIK